MADLTTQVRLPGLSGAQAANYTPLAAADFFTAVPNSMYILHYKNGATPTGSGVFTVTDPTTPIPPGSGAVAGFADGILKPTGVFAANAEFIARIGNSSRFMDATGKVNLVHGGGTLTTATVAILGPFPPSS
jgi:hypothetical protein